MEDRPMNIYVTYRISPSTPELYRRWAAAVDEPPAPFTRRSLAGGHASAEEVSVTLWTHKSKAAEYGAALDRYFGAHGELTENAQ
jgi:hypothetical protein